MRPTKLVCSLLAALALAATAAAPASAGGRGHGRGHHGHGHGHGHGGGWYSSFHFVLPLGYWGPRAAWGPRWYPPYGYGYGYGYPGVSGAVVVAPPPPVYVQQDPAYWYWCRSPEGYYPYVESCAAGWVTVAPGD